MTDITNRILQRLRDGISATDFEDAALSVFRYQYAHNKIYGDFVRALGINADTAKSLTEIPFLPISFFRTHEVITGNFKPELTFESSGTTGQNTSKHFVRSAEIYRQTYLRGFKQFYGEPDEYTILALLPSYLERGNSSLVHMVQGLIELSDNKDSGFYLNEYEKLHQAIRKAENSGRQVLLIGVTFALLDFAEQYPGPLKNTIVMETGGMKGRREEMTRTEVHDYLKQQWQLSEVHSEYGMTELLSQGYSKGHGIFNCIDTMRVLVRDVNDPLDVSPTGSGALNVVDLANIYSCSFIATEDIAVVKPGGSFEVLGRMDHSVLRGCNLLVI